MRAVFGAVLALCLVAVPAADAAKRRAPPSYHSPHYKGTRKAPKTAPPPAPIPIPLSDSGQFPQVLVDAAGTAHIAWTDGEGDNADVVRYCRIKRGSTTCDNPADTQRLVWDKTYGSGDDPRFNSDSSGPKLVQIGDQLAIVDYRYPTDQPKPDGSCGSCTVLLWVSDDGGNHFTGPAVVGDSDVNGGAIAFGAADDPVIGTITDTVTGGTFFQPIHPGRYSSVKTVLGNADPEEAYGGSLAYAYGSVFAADTDLGDHIYVRRLQAGDGGDIAQWSQPTVVGGEDPTLAGGPAGIFLLSRPGFHDALGVRRIGEDVGAGAQTTVSDANATLPDIFQDGSGRLFVAWENNSGATPADVGVKLRSSTDGTHWSSLQPVLPGEPSAGQLDIGAASDGGGFVVMNRNGGVNSPGPLVATAFGPSTATNELGLGHLAGGAGDANATTGCTQISFGAVRIDTDSGCFLHGTGANARVSVTTGSLRLNGLQIVPDAGVKILLDARAHTINTTGSVSVNLASPGIPTITLWHGELHVDLGAAGSGATLFDFDTKDFASVLEGFPIDGKVQVKLQGDGVVIPIEVKLPPYLGGLDAAAVVTADERTGLHLDSLELKLDDIFLGPLQIHDLDIQYLRTGSIWDAKAEFRIPGPQNPKLMAHLRFEDGKFKQGDIGLDLFPGIPVFTDVYWHQLRLGIELDPLKLSGGVSVGAIPIPPDVWTIDIAADFSIKFGTPVVVRGDGIGSILGLRLATAGFLYSSDGYAYFTAGVQIGDDDLGFSAKGSIYVNGGHFGAQVDGQVCVVACVGAAGAVSDRGIAVCAGKNSGPSVVYHWGDSPFDVDGSLTSCYIGEIVDLPPGLPFRRRAHAAQAGARTFSVAKGESGETLKVTGAVSAPSVTLTDPSGAVITPAPASDKAAPVIAAGEKSGPVTLVGLRKPAPGTWTIQPAPGSPAIVSVGQGVAQAPPKVSARLLGHGRSRRLRYSVSTRPGLTVTFVEVARGGDHVLGAAKGSRGTIRFAPGDGPGGRRQIVADIAVDGVGYERRVLARYQAPGPIRPGRPGRPHITLHGATVTVRFRRARGARTNAVRLHSSDGIDRTVAAPKGRVVFRQVHRGTHLRVTVRGVSAAGRMGAPSVASKR
jgi:hypothetical protein